MNLATILSADVRRVDVGSNIRAIVTLKLASGKAWTTEFMLNEDSVTYKSGTEAQRSELRKKLIRKACSDYLERNRPGPPEIDRGAATVSKASFAEPDDAV